MQDENVENLNLFCNFKLALKAQGQMKFHKICKVFSVCKNFYAVYAIIFQYLDKLSFLLECLAFIYIFLSTLFSFLQVWCQPLTMHFILFFKNISIFNIHIKSKISLSRCAKFRILLVFIWIMFDSNSNSVACGQYIVCCSSNLEWLQCKKLKLTNVYFVLEK